MEGTKKLMIGTYRDKTVEYLKDNEWIFTQKLDGTNIRVHWDGYKITFGGRTDNANIPALLTNHLIKTFSTNEVEEIFEEKFGETEVTLYGEGVGEKIQAGGSLYGEQHFVLFDVMIMDTFLERHDVEDIAKTFNIPITPVVLRGTIDEAVELVKLSEKDLYAKSMGIEKPSEGLVGVPAVRIRDNNGERIIIKIKTKDLI